VDPVYAPNSRPKWGRFARPSPDLQIHFLHLSHRQVTAETPDHATPIERWRWFLRHVQELTTEQVSLLFPEQEFTEACCSSSKTTTTETHLFRSFARNPTRDAASQWNPLRTIITRLSLESAATILAERREPSGNDRKLQHSSPDGSRRSAPTCAAVWHVTMNSRLDVMKYWIVHERFETFNQNRRAAP
jgi:hypothetical protein